VLAAGQVGKFHRQTGRWPQSKSELVERGCKELDDARLAEAYISGAPEPATAGCQFFVELPYTLELKPRAPDLRIVLRDPAGKLVCRLLVVAPQSDGRDALSPQITLRTTFLACPGEGESL